MLRKTKNRAQGTCDAINNRCIFEASYSEGSSWTAFQIQDIVQIGRRNVAQNSLTHLQNTMFEFSCIEHQEGMFNSQISNGIMGFGRSPTTLVSVLRKAGVIDHAVFSLCFTKEGGWLTIGAPASDSRLREMGKAPHWARLLPSPGHWYVVEVTGVRVGHVELQGVSSAFQIGTGTIVDSGTTDTYLPQAVTEPFERAFKKVTGGLNFAGGMVYSLTPDQLQALPSVFFNLDGGEEAGGVTVEMPSHNYMEKASNGGDQYRSHLFTSQQDGAILGANVMRDHDVIFDQETGRIGWVQANCHVPIMHSEGASLNPSHADEVAS
jgi:hypothetical protein